MLNECSKWQEDIQSISQAQNSFVIPILSLEQWKWWNNAQFSSISDFLQTTTINDGWIL